MKYIETKIIEDTLLKVKQLFYCKSNTKRYFSERKMLIYAITWPAAWMNHRALRMPQQQYKKLILDRMLEIKKHGDLQKYRKYIPAYILKSIQNWFKYNGDDLYFELRSVRNAIDLVWEKFPTQSQQPDPYIEVMARTHQLIHRQKQQRKRKSSHKQIEMF